MAENGEFAVRLERLQNYEFKAVFDQDSLAPITLDEPPPLGHNKGPNPSRLLAAAVGDCLSASLLFCLQRAKVEVKNIVTNVTGALVRNEKGRLRIGRLDVQMTIDIPEEKQRIVRCLDLFEDFCIVTASVRQGIAVHVVVTNPQGQELYRDEGIQQEIS